MFRDMRRIEKQMKEMETKELLVRSDFGVLSVIQENGYPYGVPLNYVYKNGFIFFHGAKEGLKKDCIYNNEKVSFTVTDYYKILAEKFDTEYDSVIVFGIAKEVFDLEKLNALKLLIGKYSKEYINAGDKYINAASDNTSVFKIEIDHFTGKRGR